MEQVTDADCEAAEHVLDTLLVATEPKMMSHDEAEEIIRQAFAAHRRTNDQAKDEEIARLKSALEEIRDIEHRAYDGAELDCDAIEACPDCQRYKGHPIQHGICDHHRKPFYARADHDAHEKQALGYRCKTIARDALENHRA